MATKHYLMMKLVSNPTRKPSKAKMKALEHELALARVRRPVLECIGHRPRGALIGFG